MKLANPTQWKKFNLDIGSVYWISTPSITPANPATTSLEEWAWQQEGDWAAVVHFQGKWYGITNASRSIPLLVYINHSESEVACNATDLCIHESELDSELAAEFIHSGYLFGSKTLFPKVISIPAGSIYELDTSNPRCTHYSDVLHTDFSSEDMKPADVMSGFYDVVLQSFEQLVQNSRGEQLLIPLSGGADSRLLVSVLKEIDAHNVYSYTYGIPGSREVEISKEVAKAVGFPWINIELNRDDMHKKWIQPENAEFLRYCWNGESLPHIQDWYALNKLKDLSYISPHAIILPGHTVVGNAHDEHLCSPQSGATIQDAAEAVAKHHYGLQGIKKLKQLPESLQIKILDYLEPRWDAEEGNKRIQIFEELNLITRQAKYINNSMRGYEHFGFQWALPMTYHSVWQYWYSTPRSLRDEKRIEYVRFTNEKYAEITGLESEYFMPKAAQIKPTVKKKIKTTLSALHLLEPINNFYRIRTERRHPMAFEALAGNLTTAQIDRHLLRGQTMLGIYAELLIQNNWVPKARIVPED